MKGWKYRSKELLKPQIRIDRMVNKNTANYHPCPSQSISRIHPVIFLWTPKGFISPEFFLNFFLNLYSWERVSNLWCWYYWQIMWPKKLNLFLSNHAPSKTLLQGFIITPNAEENYPFLPSSIFWRSMFYPSESGEDYGVDKITKIFMNSTFFATFTFLGLFYCAII